MLKNNCILILNLFVCVILAFRNELALYKMGTIFLVESERTHCCTLIEILLYSASEASHSLGC